MLTIFKHCNFDRPSNLVPGSISDFDALSKLPKDEPNARQGKRWAPVRHGELVAEITSLLDRDFGLGYAPEQLEIDLSKDGKRMVGGMTLSNRCDLPAEMPLSYMSVAFHNSNDSTRALSIAVGQRVWICDNGMCTGEHVSRRKHTQGLDLREHLREVLLNGVAGYHTDLERTKRLWEHATKPRDKERFVYELHRYSKISDRVAARTAHLLQEPPHEEFKRDNAWCLYQAYNEASKGVSPWAQCRTLGRGWDVLEEITGLAELN